MHEHKHEHTHADGTTHTHHNHGQLGVGAPVLNIGGDIGALILYTDEALQGIEIPVSRADDPSYTPHTEVLRRTVGGTTFWAGVYSELRAGEYRLVSDEPAGEVAFTITGGQVTELDWRTA